MLKFNNSKHRKITCTLNFSSVYINIRLKQQSLEPTDNLTLKRNLVTWFTPSITPRTRDSPAPSSNCLSLVYQYPDCKPQTHRSLANTLQQLHRLITSSSSQRTSPAFVCRHMTIHREIHLQRPQSVVQEFAPNTLSTENTTL